MKNKKNVVAISILSLCGLFMIVLGLYINNKNRQCDNMAIEEAFHNPYCVKYFNKVYR